jgi:hypothetical protein
MKSYLVVLLVPLLGPSAVAEVKQVTPQGFEVSSSVDVSVSAARAYAGLTRIGRWWNPEHSYSGDASNLKLDLTQGGCFCETLPGGGWVRHMDVVSVMPDKMIRLRGALGPLQAEGVEGSLTWTIKQAGENATVSQTYVVGGFIRDGSAKWARLVDGVLSEQLARLKSFVETGEPVPR